MEEGGRFVSEVQAQVIIPVGALLISAPCCRQLDSVSLRHRERLFQDTLFSTSEREHTEYGELTNKIIQV